MFRIRLVKFQNYCIDKNMNSTPLSPNCPPASRSELGGRAALFITPFHQIIEEGQGNLPPIPRKQGERIMDVDISPTSTSRLSLPCLPLFRRRTSIEMEENNIDGASKRHYLMPRRKQEARDSIEHNIFLSLQLLKLQQEHIPLSFRNKFIPGRCSRPTSTCSCISNLFRPIAKSLSPDTLESAHELECASCRKVFKMASGQFG